MPEGEENEFIGLRKDGSQFPFHVAITKLDLHNGPVIVGFLFDMTERAKDRKRIEELAHHLEGERKRLRAILDTLPVGVVLTDVTGKMFEVNDHAKEIMRGNGPLAMSIEDNGVYKGWWADSGIKLGPKDWAGARAVLKGVATKGQIIDVERLDGSRGTILDSAAPLRNGEGRITGSVIVIMDITHQRELEHEALEAKERAELYIDLLTHDVSNMNAAIIGYLQLVIDRDNLIGKDAKQIKRSLDILSTSSHLIDSVKKIQRLEMGEEGYGSVDLGWMLEEVVQEYRNGTDVTIRYEPKLKSMVMASELLRDVFINIIGNAVKHSPGPVNIDVRLSKVFDRGREHHKVVIEDDGPGIPDEVKERMFLRLQRGRTRAGGSGLGLYLVRRLVEDHQGQVWVEDRVPGDHIKGSRFVVLLPAAPSVDRSELISDR